jgi:hypothetical protein
MKNLQKIAMISLLSMSTIVFSGQAKADEKDGTVQQYVCVRSGDDKGDLHSAFVKLTQNEISQGFGYGGGTMALKLSNNGFTAPNPNSSFAGGTVDFTLNKKNSNFQIYFKPVDVDLRNVQLMLCLRKTSGAQDRSFGPFSVFPIKAVGQNGWFVLEDDLSHLGKDFANAEVERVSYKLLAEGDNGHILIGRTSIGSRKDVLSPSTLVMDKAPCGSPATTNCAVTTP